MQYKPTDRGPYYLSTLVYEQQEILKGWQGHPKGMLQVLWERGFIDGSKSEKYYPLEGRKDQFGNVDPTTSVKMLMERQMDFVEEETLLQYHGRQLGVIIDRTPKCHPEMAGEGIEYNCGCAKGFYRRLQDPPVSRRFGYWIYQQGG